MLIEKLGKGESRYVTIFIMSPHHREGVGGGDILILVQIPSVSASASA